jgi:hypothetical protein
MSERGILPFRYVLADIVRHFIAMLSSTVLLVILHYSVQAIVPGLKYLEVLSYWTLLAMFAFFGFNVLFQLIYRVRLSIQHVLQTRQTRPYSSTGWTSGMAGLLGFIVVFALIHRATVTADEVSKLLIFVAAFLLGFEVILMVAREVKARTIAIIFAVTKGTQVLQSCV